ncbi:MAG TPA: helix-turn-helix transcriptional regulator [Mucilaginibacter sp.]|nr:helix-turn-helix transcriptional regulator [Mucilaginibacter sp.]
MNTSDVQAMLFNHVRARLPEHLSLVDEVAELLNISNDSAYRRIRGEKTIALDELRTICNKYRISLDQLLLIQTNTVIFSGNKADNVSFGFKEYLRDIVKSLELFKTLPNPHLYYYNKDTPIFHFMPFPELRAFKFFFWKRTLMTYPDLARQQFTGEETDDETNALAEKIIALYNQVPSTEIWNEENIHSTIRQIEFYRQSNIFIDNQVLKKVYEQMDMLLDHLEIQAEVGKKFLPGHQPLPNAAPYDIYVNECLIGDNTIFVDSDKRQITFLNHNGINFTATQDQSFCDYTFRNLQNIIRKSTHISRVGEKERSMFFNNLHQKIHSKLSNIS